MSAKHASRQSYYLAILFSGIANFLLGASTLYWKEFSELPTVTLVAYRIVLSTIILAALLFIPSNLRQIKQLTKKSITIHFFASFLIAINWGTFIWASINGFVLESGLGYLLAPFISIGLSLLVFNDQISRNKAWSISIALISIILLIFWSENLSHFTYLTIAFTWGSYTYIKKTTILNALSGLFLETFFLSLCLALAVWLLSLPIILPSRLPEGTNQLIWIAGIVSVTPLLMFSFSSGKIPLSLTGLMQFILPLTLLSIGLLFGNPEIPNTSQIMIITITSMLLILVAYDTLVTRGPDK
ncbi:EamA family transporter [Pseudomonas rhodesiae]|uniref:EamA family transporter n=1 Tax=Pseudomonas rhodesiae TaxID=76760 RepID=UPI0028B107C8|nr:hypothetical protein [Pseudomonas rhodesiae]